MHSFARLDPQQLSTEARRLLRLGRPRRAASLSHGERRAEILAATLFAAAASGLVLLAPDRPGSSVALAVAYVTAYAVLSRVEYRVGTGYTIPTQLVLVPMLFALPPAAVPALVALADLMGNLPELVRGRLHHERAVLSAGDAWHALGPAAVFVLADVHGPHWNQWPVYLLALGAQLGFDLIAAVCREWAAGHASLRRQLPLIGWVYSMDALLAPLGLLAAFASRDEPYAFLLLLPCAALFWVFTREREANIGRSEELGRAYRGTATLLSQVLDDASPYTGSHSRDVVSLSSGVAGQLGVAPELARQTEFTALLHDIGKIAIPKSILDKPGSLTEEEWALMRTHTIEGQRMLDEVGGTLSDVGHAVRASHERWDGHGYPDGLAGEEIPLAARIVSCCDAFHAMTSDRPYRAAMDAVDAAEELRQCGGKQFDPAVVDALLELLAVPARPQAAAANSPEPEESRPEHPTPLRHPSLKGELEAHADHIALVAYATRELARTDSRKAARAAICEAAQEVSGATTAVLLEPSNGGFVESGRAGQRGLAAGPVRVTDLDGAGPSIAEGLGAASAHLERIEREGETLGAMAVAWDHPLGRLPEAVTATMRLLAAEAALAMERTDLVARLRAAVRTDELTGALNRGAWREELDREIARSSRERRPLCVVLLDIDHFKAYNDRHGHPAGDDLLCSSVRAWRDELRLTDQLGRYGGDEFIVLLSGCSLHSGRDLVGRLSGLTGGGQTCSAGIAEWAGMESSEQLIKRADAALLAAKQNGRDRVVSAT